MQALLELVLNLLRDPRIEPLDQIQDRIKASFLDVVHLPNLAKKLLEHRAQLHYWPHFAVGHARANAITFAVKLPSDDRRAGLALVALFPARTSLTIFALTALPALSTHQLPTITRTDARVVALGNERCAV